MLPKENRLKKEKDFSKVFKQSRPITAEHFSIRISATKAFEETKIGFVVSNKVNKLAVRRNALRRQLREISRSLISELGKGYDVVVVVKKDPEYPYKRDEIEKEIQEIFSRAKLRNKQ